MAFSISTEPQGHNLKGIIYKLKNELSISNPITSNYVIPSTSGKSIYNVDTLVLWDSSGYQTAGINNGKPWIQLEFPNRYVFPNAYSMRGVKDASWCYANQWKVFGIYEDDILNENDWILLGLNDTTEAPYCNNLNSQNNCNDFNVGTFKMKKISLKKGFRFLRWVYERSNDYCGTCHYFAASALDIYGTLSDKRVQRKGISCYCYTKVSFLNVLLFNALSIK